MIGYRKARLALLLAALSRPLVGRALWLAPAPAGQAAPGQAELLAPSGTWEGEANVSKDATTGARGSLGLRFYDALRDLAARAGNGPICLAVSGTFMGRLSNTVSMMNTVLRHSLNASKILKANISFKYPQTYTPWMKKESLDMIFGTEPVCPNQDIPVYEARCPSGSTGEFVDGRQRCNVQDMTLSTASAAGQTSSLCGCGQVVLVPLEEMKWDHLFERTHASLSEHYWQSQPDTIPLPGNESLQVPGAFPRQVMMHVRLGDIEMNCSARFSRFNCNKKLKADFYVQTVQALLAVLPPRCMELSVLTDGRENSPDILQIMGNLSSTGLQAPRIWTSKSLNAAKTFHLMTHADILIYGSSGFSQLAAVLAKPETARLGPPMPATQQAEPFYYLSNTTQVRANKDDVINMAEAVKKVRKNAAIQAFAEECRHRLGLPIG